MAVSRASKELARFPVGNLLWKYSVPAIVGMLVMALYNVVDRLYVGRCVGPDGLAGFALTFPPMMVMLAFGLLLGVGTATRISIAMGQGKRSVAQCYLGQAVCVYLLLSFLVYPLCAFFVEPLLEATGGTAATIPPAADYLRIVFWCAAFQYLSFGLNHTIRAEGHPTKALMTMLIGAVLNAVLDPFFIFDEVPLGFCTLPGLGLKIQGAAIATCLSQAVSAAWVLAHFLRPSAGLRLRWGFVRLYRPLLWGVVVAGLPPFALNLVGSAITALYNILFKALAPTEAVAGREIAAIGIVMTVQMLVCMPVLGVAQGMQPILGFNYGARNYRRMRRTFNLAAWWGGGYIALASALVLLFENRTYTLRDVKLNPILGQFVMADIVSKTIVELSHTDSRVKGFFERLLGREHGRSQQSSCKEELFHEILHHIGLFLMVCFSYLVYKKNTQKEEDTRDKSLYAPSFCAQRYEYRIKFNSASR